MRWCDSGFHELTLGACLGLALTSCGGGFAMQPGGEPPEPQRPGAEVPDLGDGDRCGPYTPETLMACVDRERIEGDVRAIAQPRPPGSAHHRAVRDRCAQRLTELGYEVALHDYGTGTNVIGTQLGFSKPNDHLILSAHYDDLTDCPGADDNASGVAVLLETARVLATARFDRSLLVACWDEGERGQLGSAAYAQQARRRGDRIVAVFSYEAVGFASSEPDSQRVPDRFDEAFPDQALVLLDSDYRANFLMVVAETATEPAAAEVVRYGKSITLPVHVLSLTERHKVKQKKLHRSDQASFWDAGYPALLLTDTGNFRNPHHHCRDTPDGPATLDYQFTAAAAQAGLGAAVELLELR